MDLTIDQLPLPEHLKKLLIRRHRAVLLKGQPAVAYSQDLGTRLNSVADIHFSVIPREDHSHNVLIMFEPVAKRRDSAKEQRKNNKRT